MFRTHAYTPCHDVHTQYCFIECELVFLTAYYFKWTKLKSLGKTNCLNYSGTLIT